MHYDAIVLGGGLVGHAAGYYLSQGGARTLLIDKPRQGRATDVGAGIIAPETGTNKVPAWFKLAIAAKAHYPALITELAAAGFTETGFAASGKLTLSITEDEKGPYERAKNLIFARREARQQPDPNKLYEVRYREAKRLFPLLKTMQKAIYLKEGFKVDGRLLSIAIQQAAEQQYQLQRLTATQTDLAFKGEDVLGVWVDSQFIPAGQVIIAAGAWSGEFAAAINRPLPVAAQRGELAIVKVHHVAHEPTETWAMVSAFHGHYIVPWAAGRFTIGATRQFEPDIQPWQTVGGLHQVFSEAMRVAPALRQAEILETKVGLRPRTPDRLPILGTVPSHNNLFIATGHGPTGLQLGPYSGKLVADLMLGQPSSFELAPYNLNRFW